MPARSHLTRARPHPTREWPKTDLMLLQQAGFAPRVVTPSRRRAAAAQTGVGAADRSSKRTRPTASVAPANCDFADVDVGDSSMLALDDDGFYHDDGYLELSPTGAGAPATRPESPPALLVTSSAADEMGDLLA